MPARRCSNCSLNFPLHVVRCRRCEGELWHSTSNEPDEDWMTITPDSPAHGLEVLREEDRVVEHRTALFVLVCGYALEDAQRIAVATDSNGVLVRVDDVARCIDARRAALGDDAARALALRVYA